jgi:hypothetical protein
MIALTGHATGDAADIGDWLVRQVQPSTTAIIRKGSIEGAGRGRENASGDMAGEFIEPRYFPVVHED